MTAFPGKPADPDVQHSHTVQVNMTGETLEEVEAALQRAHEAGAPATAKITAQDGRIRILRATWNEAP